MNDILSEQLAVIDGEVGTWKVRIFHGINVLETRCEIVDGQGQKRYTGNLATALLHFAFALQELDTKTRRKAVQA